MKQNRQMRESWSQYDFIHSEMHKEFLEGNPVFD